MAYAWNAGQRVTYWREEQVDGVLEASWGSWAVEVKTGAFSVRDLRGLLEFTRRHPKLRPLVLCDPGRVESATRGGVLAMAWRDFLWAGPTPTNP